MKNKYWILIIIAAIVVVGGIYLYSTYSGEGENWIVEINENRDVMLAAECADDNYITNSADYILDIKINKIDTIEDERTYSLDIVGWIKGKPTIVPKSLSITTSSLASSEDPIFEEGKDYRVNLKKVNNQIVLVCGFRGVQELSRI